jgi:hypothetical protein
MIYKLYTKAMGKIQVAHPTSIPVLDSYDKQHSNRRREGQNAIEDYLESYAKVQILYLQIRKVGGSHLRNCAVYRNCCSVLQPTNLLWLRAPAILI